jgi:hypothetical protein
MTMTLILAGEAIVAVTEAVTEEEWGYATVEAHYPFAAGVTGLERVEALPDGFDLRYCRWDGGRIVCEVPAPPAGWRDAYLSRIDAAAEAERGRYITLGAGQALTYQAKQGEAARLLADAAAGGDIVPAAYPWIVGEVGITAPAVGDLVPDMVAVARVMDGNARAWAAMGAAIEVVRLAAKEAVRASPDAAMADAVMAGLVWPAVPV